MPFKTLVILKRFQIGYTCACLFGVLFWQIYTGGIEIVPLFDFYPYQTYIYGLINCAFTTWDGLAILIFFSDPLFASQYQALDYYMLLAEWQMLLRTLGKYKVWC